MSAAGALYLRATARRLDADGRDVLARRAVTPRSGGGPRPPPDGLGSEERRYQAGRGRPELAHAARLERVATGPTRCEPGERCGECAACWLSGDPLRLP